MNTKSLFIAALIVMGAWVNAIGKDEPRTAGFAVIPGKGSGIVKVIYRGENSGKVKLNIYDSESQIIFTESFSAGDGFIRPLNFAGLPYGQYTIEVVDAAGKKGEKIFYGPSKAKSSIHVSKVDPSGKFLVTIANAEKATVKIYDQSNNLLHTETFAVAGGLAKLYKVVNTTGITFEVSDLTGNTKTVRF